MSYYFVLSHRRYQRQRACASTVPADQEKILKQVLRQPIYEAHLTTSKTSVSSSVPPAPLHPHPSYALFGTGSAPIGYPRKDSEEGRHVVQLVAHASLDALDDLIWTEKSMYLKNVDRFHEWSVSALVPPGGPRLVILHEIKNEDGIKLFLLEAWEFLVRNMLSPFYETDAPIKTGAFDSRIKASARRFPLRHSETGSGTGWPLSFRTFKKLDSSLHSRH
ncbi:hypothetical protein CROQUDRAFT_101388 [Cronartium quercuum f. sp. fusiforme G11]|uniref:Uncharacterized protein n=1 Tax=Cronartium quercuum f. sp. fusiforme G11 TaxID=708437 RepID=A0A9P6N867_9BASI|nr:hypothetical protein CROQUDRAFT_101388 [Cronartium quercuum f. sp. fusiforme G11]